MQVANTLNNNIRILFNPRIEAFKLFDFLIVKSDDSKYIAQITEIYDDKFDASQNVAKIKLFYRINDNNEVIPYDNFTPNKECEISKVKQDEIEAFINQDKETFILGTNAKTSSALNVQYDFFNNNAVVLADKVENANCITFNLAKKLSAKKNALIIDTTGILEFEEAKKITAAKNFKMPLNYSTIDHVFNRCLYDASLEFQAIGGEIINEIKKFARRQENKFIPFNLLTRVLIQQHKATPYPELRLLLARLKKYQMDEIFARTKNEKDALFKAIEKNPITIVDLSNLDSYWQKAYINYIISDIEQEIYLITRINDEHFGADLINKIYSKKKNITFVPNVSYNYKKLPSVMQYCKNYILMPSLTQRADFLDANFALANLISEGCIVFGENTDNFIYLAKDYELAVQEKRKNYRKIALTLAKQDETEQNLGQKGDYFKNKDQEEISDSAKLIQELSEFEASQQEALARQNNEEYIETNAPGELLDDVRQTKETFEEIENPQPQEQQEIQEKDELVFEDETEKIKLKSEASDEFQDILHEEESKEEEPESQAESDSKDSEESEEETEEDGENSDNDLFKDVLDDTKQQEAPLKEEDELLVQDSDSEEKKSENEAESEDLTIEPEDLLKDDDKETDELPILDDTPLSQPEEASKDDSEDTLEMDTIDANDLSDEELDFFQMAQDSEDEESEAQDEIKEENPDDDIDLSEMADNSLETSFEEIINTKNPQNAQTIALDEKTNISADILNQPPKKENLPIFKDEEKKDQNTRIYEVGNVIVHKKYGRGTVVKTIKYEERQLLQIEFDEAGKKLLDPTVADIKPEQ